MCVLIDLAKAKRRWTEKRSWCIWVPRLFPLERDWTSSAGRVRKWTPLKSRVVPARGSSFGPFIVAHLLKRLFQAEADLTSNSCDWNLELGRRIFARLLLLTLWGPKKGPLPCHTCTWFVTRKAPCYLAVTWTGAGLKFCKGFVWGHWLVPSSRGHWVTFKIVL